MSDHVQFNGAITKAVILALAYMGRKAEGIEDNTADIIFGDKRRIARLVGVSVQAVEYWIGQALNNMPVHGRSSVCKIAKVFGQPLAVASVPQSVPAPVNKPQVRMARPVNPVLDMPNMERLLEIMSEIDPENEGVSETQLAVALQRHKGTVSRRMHQAAHQGLVKNIESRPGVPSRWVIIGGVTVASDLSAVPSTPSGRYDHSFYSEAWWAAYTDLDFDKAQQAMKDGKALQIKRVQDASDLRTLKACAARMGVKITIRK